MPYYIWLYINHLCIFLSHHGTTYKASQNLAVDKRVLLQPVIEARISLYTDKRAKARVSLMYEVPRVIKREKENSRFGTHLLYVFSLLATLTANIEEQPCKK